jgi:lysophospholipase L1-like esterase
MCKLMTILLATLLLAGCPTYPKKVLLIGDSIMAAAMNDVIHNGNLVSDGELRIVYTAIVVGGSSVGAIIGEPANPDTYWGELLDHMIDPGGYDLVVVGLGTNDCTFHSSDPSYPLSPSPILDAVSTADPSLPVLWVTVPAYPQHTPGCASEFNSKLHDTLPYGEWFNAHPEYFSDGVHLNINGASAYSVWLTSHLDSYFG